MRLDRVRGNRLLFEFEKSHSDDSAGHLSTSGKRAEGRVHSDHGPVSTHEEDYGDDDVFMDSYTVNGSSSPSGVGHDEAAAVTEPITGIQSAPASLAQVTSGGEEVSGHSGNDESVDVCMKSEPVALMPRRPGRLLRRRLFPKSKAQWTESGGRSNRLSVTDSSDDLSDQMVAKEKLVSLSQEKLRSYSTDLHSNSDGLRNRVLVESTLKKFLLNEMDSPPRISQPSTPRKRSVTCVSPLYSSPSCPSSPSGPAFAFDDDTTKTLSDCIKRMRIMHTSPSSRTSLSLEEEESGVERDVVHPVVTHDPTDDHSQLHDFPMTDLAAVFRKIHCLTDLPIDSEF